MKGATRVRRWPWVLVLTIGLFGIPPMLDADEAPISLTSILVTNLFALAGERLGAAWFRTLNAFGPGALSGVEASATPGPVTLFLLGSGLAGAGLVWRRRITSRRKR